MVYNVIGKSKVYSKSYFRKNKQGKKEQVESVQKTIAVPKDSKFTNNEVVRIIKDTDFQILQNPNISVDKLQSENQQLQMDNEKLKKQFLELQEQHHQLKDSNSSNTLKLSNELMEANKTIDSLKDEIVNLNKYKDNAVIQKLEMEKELTEYKAQDTHHRELIEILLLTTDTAIDTAINETMIMTIKNANKIIDGKSFFSRLKGFNLNVPDIGTDSIKEKSMKTITDINKNYLK